MLREDELLVVTVYCLVVGGYFISVDYQVSKMCFFFYRAEKVAMYTVNFRLMKHYVRLGACERGHQFFHAFQREDYMY